MELKNLFYIYIFSWFLTKLINGVKEGPFNSAIKKLDIYILKINLNPMLLKRKINLRGIIPEDVKKKIYNHIASRKKRIFLDKTSKTLTIIAKILINLTTSKLNFLLFKNHYWENKQAIWNRKKYLQKFMTKDILW